MLPENAPVLIGRIKMLSNARREIVLSRVRADADDTFYAMSLFAPLEEHIDSIIGHLSEVFASQTRQPESVSSRNWQASVIAVGDPATAIAYPNASSFHRYPSASDVGRDSVVGHAGEKYEIVCIEVSVLS